MVHGPVGKSIYPRFGKRESLTCIDLRVWRSLLKVVLPQRADHTQMPVSRRHAHTTDVSGAEVVATYAAAFLPRIHDIVHLWRHYFHRRSSIHPTGVSATAV